VANPTVWIIRIFKTADGWRALKPLWSKRSGKPLLTQRCLYKETEIDTPGGRWEIEWVPAFASTRRASANGLWRWA
jgi:hypothetical protein